jgi:hypothetical protein
MMNGDIPETTSPTQIAVLGTLAEFHQEPLPYDLQALVSLVADINPDLLCLDMTLEQWQTQDFSRLPEEYSQALLPLAAQTDIVVVPIGGEQLMPRATAVGWRGWVITAARKLLSWIQSGAPGPDAINEGWRHDIGNIFYNLARQMAGEQVTHAYHTHIEQVSQAALEAARNNPGNRILVVTNIQYCHHIRPLLQQQMGIIETSYKNL